MTGKLQGNGLWESSRMMLPEHKEAILNSNRYLQKRTRVQLDEQELERVSRIVMESQQEGREVALRLFGEYEEHHLNGIVVRLDPGERRVCLRTDAGMEWVLWRDIVSAEFTAGYTDD
ncbi:YolD-like family protein [Paenibacillus sp. GM2]|uniref:YolD-like family protein n=1 Tax=Paenibacillus sp. GM2 TaxID=1622070 RepID=UPI000839D26C|nr:YolD-like family protein [Paenibacillus sp. GM2]